MRNSKLGYLNVLLLVLPYLLVVGAFQFFAFTLLGFDFHNLKEAQENATTFQHLIISVFGLVGSVAIIYLFRIKLDEKSFMSLGLSIKKRGREIILGLSIGILVMVFLLAILLTLGFTEIVDFDIDFLEVLLVLLLFISVSFSEEILIRGYVLNNFMGSSNKYLALIISSLLFALMHAFNPNISMIGLFDLFLAGILLGITYIFTKNLWFAFSLHFSWNFFQAMLGFNVSGMNIYSVLELKTKPSIWTGGEFGLEGSILSSIIQVILIIYLYFRYKKQIAL